MEGYTLNYYIDSRTGEKPAQKFIKSLPQKAQLKIFKYLKFLQAHNGYLDEPYSRHIFGKIRELRVDFGKNKHRIFYFTFVKKNIMFLHAFLKTTQKTPVREIKKAEDLYYHIINNQNAYE